MSSSPLVTLDRIAVRVRDRLLFSGSSWEMRTSQHWAVIGPNGAGKTSLVGAIAGELPVVRGSIRFHAPLQSSAGVGYISFEHHRRLIAREDIRDEARSFSNRCNDEVTVRELLQVSGVDSAADFKVVAARLDLEGLLERPARRLSTGEIRQVLIAREILRAPHLLILDEVFEGLDTHNRSRLRRIMENMMADGVRVIQVTHRLKEILPGITHVLALKDGRIEFQGERDRILQKQRIENLYRSGSRPSHARCRYTAENSKDQAAELVKMENVTVRYADRVIFENVSWRMLHGENWAITGPNGAGKTTLLSLICGDHPQAYANRIDIFGRPRGSGETIWEIKQHIGQVSAELQIRYRKALRASEVVLSGFFDSVGLYRRSTAEQRRIAAAWIKKLHMEDRADRPFQALSQGEQRMILIARAMVKSPLLLILDEPCQGLDRSARALILDLLDDIGARRKANLLFVTHYREEILDSVSHVLRFEKSASGSYRAFVDKRR